MKKHFGHRLIKKRQSRYHTSLPRTGKGDRVSGSRVLSLAAQMRRAFPCTTSCLSYRQCPIRPYGAPSPRGEGCDTRIPSSKKGGEAASIQQSSLHFGRDDVQERRITSHSLSHRCVDPSCAFSAPLLQGPTRIVYNTDSSKTRNVSPR